MPVHSASADEPTLRDRGWLVQNWEIARLKARHAGRRKPALLILDEVQKISGWSDTVKALWDADTRDGLPLHVLLLGSAALLLQHRLAESLAGRFEGLHATHWSYQEMRDAFRWSLDRYLYFGGYPGAAKLLPDEERWRGYIRDSLIETTISRDVLLLSRVDKPALLRRLFHIACEYSGQIVSYQKMLGQLQEAGNTTTLAHYLWLLEGAGLLSGLPKYSGKTLRQRASSPRLQVLNTALMTVHAGRTSMEALQDAEYKGRLVEVTIGAHLWNALRGSAWDLSYWRERDREVDFVLRRGTKLVAVEVKSGATKTTLPGINAFLQRYPLTRPLLVGAQGIPVGEFLLSDIGTWID
jgi:uncharacterized protein